MKHSIFYIPLFALLSSCSKTEFKETKDTLSQANELIKSAKEGLKNMDSISLMVEDSAEFHRVIVPQIEKHKRSAERLIKGNAKTIDSLNTVLKETAGTIEKSTDLLKTVDSARLEINENSSAFDILGTVTKTLNKIANQTKAKPKSPSSAVAAGSSKEVDSTTLSSASPANSQANTTVEMRGSRASMKVSVEDLDRANSTLENGIHLYDAKIKSESYGEVQGKSTRELTLLIPTCHFERALDYFGTKLGTLRTKSMETWSFNGSTEELSTLELTLEQSSSYAGNSPLISNSNEAKDNPNDREPAKNAFMQGLDYAKQALIFLLPFWPLLLLVIIGIYFWKRAQKRKAQKQTSLLETKREPMPRPEPSAPEKESSEPKENAPSQAAADLSRFAPKPKTTAEEDTPSKEEPDSDPEDPYAKYKPKF